MTAAATDQKQQRADRIATAVSERMRQLGHTYESMAEASVEADPTGEGLSVSGIAKVVQGKVAHPQRRTARALEEVLRWPYGTLARVAEGEEPPAEDIGEPDVRQRLDELEGQVEELTELLRGFARLLSPPGEGPESRRGREGGPSGG